MADDTVKLLADRGKTHGEYRDHARATQGIMRVLMAEKNWSTLPDIMKESLHMFAHKMGRVVTGDPFIADHWFDIEGYSRLVRERLELVKADPDDIYTIFAKATGVSRDEAKKRMHMAAYGGQPVAQPPQATATASPASEVFQQPPSVLGEAIAEGLAIPAEPPAPRVPRPLSDDGTKHHVNPAPFAVNREFFDMMGGADKSAYKFASVGGILSDHLSTTDWAAVSERIKVWYMPMEDGAIVYDYVIDRSMMSPTDRESCMVYQAELNNSEFNHIPEGSWQRKLYGPIGEKMIMLPKYRELWAK